MNLPEYALYAIRYAGHPRTRRENLIGDDDRPDAPMPIDYFVWAIKAPGGEAWVVDTGFVAANAAKRGRHMERTPAEGLALVGIDAAQVADVVLTHVHWDHAGGQDLFPAARFHVQASEMAYVSGPCMCEPRLAVGFEPGDIAGLVEKLFARRLVFHHGDAELAPGLSLHRVAGHTDGMMVVRAHTRRGFMVLASDATHFYENMSADRPFPFFHDLRGVRDGFRRMRELADREELIIPGHDPLVLARHPAPEPSLAGIVARLD
ncbi:MAG: N-acyl homoserine lactonase family protein [Alphaproteobacteria bacterium]